MSEPIIDQAALRKLLNVIGGDHEELRELVEDFAEVGPELVGKLQAARDSNDLNALRVAAHTLKSNSKDFGALELSALCESLEQACKTGEVNDASAQVAKIEAAERAAQEALASMNLEDV